MLKKNVDFVDKIIQRINWKIGNFSMLPIFFGTLMASLDIAMMGVLKMTSTGSLSRGVGIPLSVCLYALEPLIFLKALNYDGMVVTNLVWNLMSNIIVTLQGIFVFGESIKGLRWLGVLMSLFSLGLLAYTDS
jgi:multidrug transporter EmrE-like cation transporter